MFLLAAACLCFEGAYTRISVTEFLDHVWNINSDEAHNVAATDYFKEPPNNTCYVIREKGERIITHNYTYYYVYGTKKEIALLTKQFEPLAEGEEPRVPEFSNLRLHHFPVNENPVRAIFSVTVRVSPSSSATV